MATRDVTVRITTEMATVTEREAVLRERAAYRRGLRDGVECRDNAAHWSDSDREHRSAMLYPLPKVTRPRVLKNDTVFGSAYEFTVIDGAVKERLYGGPWKTPSGWPLTADVVDAWADLLANPTEEVEA